MSFLSGYKTYIVGAASILGAIGAYASGTDTLPQTVQLIITAILAMTVRSGVSSGK